MTTHYNAETRKDRAQMIFDRVKNRQAWIHGDFEQQEDAVWDIILSEKSMADAFNDYRYSNADSSVRANFEDLISDLLDLDDKESNRVRSLNWALKSSTNVDRLI